MRAFTTRLCLVAANLLTLLALAVPAAPHAAADTVVRAAADSAGIEQPIMFFGFDAEPTYHDICGNGTLRNPPAPSPQWNLDVSGSRSTPGVILGSASDTRQNAFVCVRVEKFGAQYGSYTATFRYQALPSDPPSVIVAEVTWYPGTNGEIVATGQ